MPAGGLRPGLALRGWTGHCASITGRYCRLQLSPMGEAARFQKRWCARTWSEFARNLRAAPGGHWTQTSFYCNSIWRMAISWRVFSRPSPTGATMNMEGPWSSVCVTLWTYLMLCVRSGLPTNRCRSRSTPAIALKVGMTTEDAVIVARALKERGCDIIAVQAGQTTDDGEPAYGRGFLTAYSDRIRNEAGMPTIVGGYLTTSDEVNTVIAAGRADLCIVEPLDA